MNSSSSELTPQQTMQLLEQYQETGCNDTATALLRHYEPIVRMAAGKLSRSRPDLYEDMYQVGQMSMLRLFAQYNADREIPFEAYAMKSVVGHLKNYLRDKSWYIQVPRRLKEKGLLLGRAIDDLSVQLGRSPNVDEIANYLELSVEETIEVMTSRESYQYVSLDTPLSSEGESAATIGDMISTNNDEMLTLDGRLDLQEAFGKLKDEEAKVLTLVYSSGLSQREIAAKLGISQMSVSRIQRRAIGKLRELLGDDYGESAEALEERDD
ncbi:RNA polymerase subunit sigma-70 [Paenibacillus sp. MY03]|jgi:RNA polymerase sigma-B factor|uniref:DNA-directed RNA polymerase sigma-70 factor n=1 Tax=Paenibacillus agaridevorans TaxID=171404 RepID=A0A2R5EYT6_9BACL|nr:MULTISPECIES: sigma-70 family RNA polymerase sigma factor [Paenibacillus]OUS74963.1 RNA polymerase subunit sigma-70 [Paenibacillus sp. MY03]GBG10819.1 DNA-directed RNA polymerase sigma-70 factor [Paenibacillus agaridevorans]